MLEHLQSLGVRWLPKPCAENVASLQERMTRSRNASRASSVDMVVDQPTPESTPADKDSPKEQARTPGSRDASLSIQSQPVDAVGSAEGPYVGDELGVDDRQRELGLMAELVSKCTRCEILSSCRNKTVFGEGSVTPRVVFFGEGPGADEDRTGRPFVGRAGQLLTKMIEACKFRREDVYILNTVKCRPPGNRNPEQGEIDSCREYYQRQLAILRPEYIVCLGAISARELLQTKLTVGELRRSLHRYFESKVLVTYHPSYLLRNPSAKKASWEDLQILLRDAKIRY